MPDWSRKKEYALIKGEFGKLPDLSVAYRDKVSLRTSDITQVVEVLETTIIHDKNK